MSFSESLQEGQLKPEALEQKGKHFVVKVMEDDDEPFSNDAALWLRFNSILTMNDQLLIIIESGMCLIDHHINFAQRLLKWQFPHLNGLRSTLLNDKPHYQPTISALQLLHIKRGIELLHLRRTRENLFMYIIPYIHL